MPAAPPGPPLPPPQVSTSASGALVVQIPEPELANEALSDTFKRKVRGPRRGADVPVPPGPRPPDPRPRARRAVQALSAHLCRIPSFTCPPAQRDACGAWLQHLASPPFPQPIFPLSTTHPPAPSTRRQGNEMFVAHDYETAAKMYELALSHWTK